MKSVKLLGSVGLGIGVATGTYLAVAPVLQGFKSGAMSGADVGHSLAIIGTILGVFCAAIGIVYGRIAAAGSGRGDR